MTTQHGLWLKEHKIVVIIIISVGFLIVAIGLGSNTVQTTSSTESTASTQPSASTTKTETKAAPSVPPEYSSALVQANSYANSMHMSKAGVYDQLTSDYGEKFTPEAAQYGIDHVTADWDKNALATAKSYQNSMHMSPAAIHDQLTSDAGEKFTASEADYAIQHLND